MTSPVSLVIVSPDQRLWGRIESLTRGSRITVLGTTPLSDQVIPQIARIKPRVVVLDGRAPEKDYIPFVRELLAAAPGVKCLLFGESVDVAVMARAVVAGVCGYLPTTYSYPDFIETIVAAVEERPPAAESAFTRTALAMSLSEVGAGDDASARRGIAARRRVASECLKMGLTVAETARYLDMPEEQVAQRDPQMALAGLGRGFFTNRRLLYGAAMAGLLWTMWKVTGVSDASMPRTKPVSAQLLYDDGSPLPVRICELTFYPTQTPDTGRVRLGRAVLTGQTGRIDRVCYDAKFRGLPAGIYKVTVRLPGQVPLPSYIAAGEYGDPIKTPLTLETGEDRAVLTIKKPKELMERFDRDADGTLESIERVAVREAVNDLVAEMGRD